MLTTRFGTFGPPPDVVAWSALALAVCWLAASSRVHIAASFRTVLVVALGAGAASFGYVAYYLRGAPRIIDATSYWLEARTLASGHFTFQPPGPLASFAGRFLLTDESGERLGVIFPPGYPLALALATRLGNAMALGPLLAVLLVLVTYALAVQLFSDPRLGLCAALLSAVSACLRYHTADTMSHGWAALLFSACLWFGARPGRAAATLSGLCLGWLVATRPVTALPAALTWLLMTKHCGLLDWRRLLGAALGIAPGIALLLAYNDALTGSVFSSPQLTYYAQNDTPPGCFRYGFGEHVGCRVEHGDFVERYLPNGYGLLAALGTTGRRLALHARDAGNSEVFGLAVLAALMLGRRLAPLRIIAVALGAQVMAYAPFYFDGNYPGGGARFFVDVLPLEHLALAWLGLQYRFERWLVPAALVGFAVHSVYDHRQLMAREGGAPMFEPKVLEAAGVRSGLVFVETDHGFNLGYDPTLVPSRASTLDSIVVARERGTAPDAQLREALGHPPAYEYRFDPYAKRSEPRLVPYRADAYPGAP